MKFIREGHQYSNDELADLFKGDRSHIVASLFTQLRNGRYSTDFVGFVSSRQDVYFSAPKVNMDAPDGRASGNLLRNVLEHFMTRIPNTNSLEVDQARRLEFKDESLVREIEIYLSLANFYMINGLYIPEARTENRTYDGRINWSKTLARTLPLHCDEGSLYTDPINHSYTRKPDEVSQIFASVLAHLDSKYGGLFIEPLAQRMKADVLIISEAALLANRTRWSALLMRAMQGTARTDHLSMFLALRQFFEDHPNGNGSQGPRLLGTFSFHSVWEDALKFVFDDQFEDMRHQLAQPIWHFLDARGTTKLTGGKQRPDVLLETKDKILVIDAKYYYPLPTERCGWTDLVKQLFYSESIVGKAKEQVRNVLVFPASLPDKIRVRGKVLLEHHGSAVKKFSEILVVEVDANLILRAYAKRVRLPLISNQLREICYPNKS